MTKDEDVRGRRIWEIFISNQIKSFYTKILLSLEKRRKMRVSRSVSIKTMKKMIKHTAVVLQHFAFTSRHGKRERECNKRPITSIALNSSYRAGLRVKSRRRAYGACSL